MAEDNPFLKNIREEAERVIGAIESGVLDDLLTRFVQAVDHRNQARRDEVLKLVKQAFGEDARVVVNPVNTTSEGVLPPGSFGITNTTDNGVPDESEEETPATETDGAKPDALAHLDEVEARMESEDADSESPPAQQQDISPERRGAVISGLHPSDMGD